MNQSGISKSAAVIIAVIVTAVVVSITMYAVFFYEKDLPNGNNILSSSPPSPSVVYASNTIYLTTYQNQPALLLNREIVPYPAFKDNPSYWQNQGLTDVEIASLNKRSVMETESTTKLLSMKASSDGKFLIFTGGLQRNLGITGEVYAYRYDIAENRVTLLFSNTDVTYPSTSRGYFTIQEISPDNQYARFFISPCVGDCDAMSGETLLMEFVNGQFRFKNIGPVTEFRWVGGGNYEYKEFIWETECGPGNDIGCFQDPATLPWKQGNWE